MCWFFPFPKKILKKLIIVSIFFSIQYSLTYSALNIIDASSASFFIQAEVPFGLLAAYLLLGEKLSFKNFIGLIVASIGIIFLTGSPNLEGKLLGVIILLSGTCIWSFAQVLAKPISKEIGGLALTAWLGVFSAPMCILASYFIEGNTINYILNANLKSWIIVIYLGVMMNVLGYSAWYYVISKHPINNIMPVLLLLPLTGLLTAIFVLGETPNVYSYIGGSIIIFGVAIILINKNQKSSIKSKENYR